MKIIRNILGLFISSSRLENLSKFYLIRVVYKRLMRFNGILNITIILKNTDYIDKANTEHKNIKVVDKIEELENYKLPNRLSDLLRQNYLLKSSKLFIIIEKGKVIAYSWLHHNFEPDGDLSLLNISDYYAVGPTFVNTSYRNKGLSKDLFYSICNYANRDKRLPLYIGVQFDNIPIIRARLNTGYKLKNIIIRLKNHQNIIL